MVANHLSRLAITHNSRGLPINDDFLEESLMVVEIAPWYVIRAQLVYAMLIGVQSTGVL